MIRSHDRDPGSSGGTTIHAGTMPMTRRSKDMRWRLVPALLAAASVVSCSAPPPASHPQGDLYLSPPAVPHPLPSTENDPNGGAN